jgi:hypothetical protein
MNLDTIHAINLHVHGAIADNDPTLGMTAGAAREAMATIAQGEADDAETLAVYDHLHARATTGRAW